MSGTGDNGAADDPFEMFDEELEAQWEAEWEEADRAAVALLREALQEHIGARPPAALANSASEARARLAMSGQPADWVLRAAALEREQLPPDDAELLVRCTAATISPQEETGLEVHEEAMITSLEQADWLGAILSVVRAGAGADATPEVLVQGIWNCPEIEIDAELDEDDELHVQTALGIVALPWHVLGLTDRDDRLTPVGEWVLPRALARAWRGDFDEPVSDRP
ncbi:MAG TPA: hypothetical protein VG325_10750 [Solirubrobacteraceae bacterium]|nr:hypothetical protein [Solirubrobacteraceae bacterium]